MPSSRTSALAVAFVALAVSAIHLVTVDAYGQCRSPDNVFRCLEATFDSARFKKLISDDELLDRFKQYHSDYDRVAKQAAERAGGDPEFSPDDFEKQLGIRWIRRSASNIGVTKDGRAIDCINSPPPNLSVIECIERYRQWQRVEFHMDITRTVDAKYWPYSNLVKSLVHYRFPPVFDASNSKEKNSSILLVASLDESWPPNWLVDNSGPSCLLRRFDSFWYAMLCRNDIAG